MKKIFWPTLSLFILFQVFGCGSPIGIDEGDSMDRLPGNYTVASSQFSASSQSSVNQTTSMTQTDSITLDTETSDNETSTTPETSSASETPVPTPTEEVFEGEITLDHMPFAEKFVFPMGGAKDHAGATITQQVGGTFNGWAGHLGCDFFQDGAGTPVYSIADGVVYYVLYRTTSNWMDIVMIRHRVKDLEDKDEWVYSFYGHLKADHSLAKGTIVKARQKIGETTLIYQNAFSPHLHIELRNTVAVLQCNRCSEGDIVGHGYSLKKEYTTKGKANSYYVPSDGAKNARHYEVDAFIKHRVD